MSLAHLGRIEEARATVDRAEEEFGENFRRYLQRPPWLRPEDYVVRVEGLRLMGLQESPSAAMRLFRPPRRLN